MRLRISPPIVIDTRQNAISRCPVAVVNSGAMYDGLITLMINTSPKGSEIRMPADRRPIDVSACTLRAWRCRSRTVSERGSKSPGNRAPDRRLTVDGRRDVLEVRGADSFAHGREGLVERTTEPLLAEHAAELFRRRRGGGGGGG